MPGLKEIFGTNLRSLRKRRGMSQEMLAEQLGLSSHSISNLERGVHAPRFTTLEKLANILDVSAEEFFRQPLMRRRRDIPSKHPRNPAMPETVARRKD